MGLWEEWEREGKRGERRVEKRETGRQALLCTQFMGANAARVIGVC